MAFALSFTLWAIGQTGFLLVDCYRQIMYRERELSWVCQSVVW